jgi:hypothetical protein
MYKNTTNVNFDNIYGGTANIDIPNDPAVLWMTQNPVQYTLMQKKK